MGEPWHLVKIRYSSPLLDFTLEHVSLKDVLAIVVGITVLTLKGSIRVNENKKC